RLLSSGIPFQTVTKGVLRRALESALLDGLLTAEHLALALLKTPGSPWLSAMRESGTDPAEVTALLETRRGRIQPSDEQPKVTATVRAVIDDAVKRARRQRVQVDSRLLTMSLLTQAKGLARDLERVYNLPVGAWLHALRAPTPPILTPGNPP